MSGSPIFHDEILIGLVVSTDNTSSTYGTRVSTKILESVMATG